MTVALPPPRAQALLVGHGRAAERFRRALAAGALHPAWMISGPRGIGKATLAWHLARELLADPATVPNAVHDPTSPLFRRAMSGSHPDLFVLEAEQGRGGRTVELAVERVSEVVERLHGTAYGSRRVVVIDPADALNRNAANALLKLLEEPPAHTVFLLVVHRLGAVPATLASRCVRLSLAPLAEPEMRQLFTALLGELTERERERLVELCEGRPGQLPLWLDGRALALYEQLLAWLEARAPASQLAPLVAAFEGHARDLGIEATCAVLALLLRRMVHAVLGTPSRATLVPRETVRLGELARRTPLEGLARLWEKLTALPRRIEDHYLDPAQVFIVALDELARTLVAPGEPS